MAWARACSVKTTSGGKRHRHDVDLKHSRCGTGAETYGSLSADQHADQHADQLEDIVEDRVREFG